MGIKHKILKYLIENKERTFSINEIAKALAIDYKLTHTNINKLQKEKSIKVEDLGNTRRCSFDSAFNADVFTVEHERRNTFLRDKNFRLIHEDLSKINNQFIALLFGSQVKGTATKHSDIDLLIIADEETSNKINAKLNLLPHNTHITAISHESFMRMLKSKELSVVSEAIKKNIILIGIEDYYRLLNNAH